MTESQPAIVYSRCLSLAVYCAVARLSTSFKSQSSHQNWFDVFPHALAGPIFIPTSLSQSVSQSVSQSIASRSLLAWLTGWLTCLLNSGTAFGLFNYLQKSSSSGLGGGIDHRLAKGLSLILIKVGLNDKNTQWHKFGWVTLFLSSNRNATESK